MKQHTTQAVILAAGKGSRMGKLPYQKSLLPAKSGKAILAYTFKGLYQAGFHADAISTVVGHKKESIQQYVGNDSMYVEQKDLNGTGGALREVLATIHDSISTLLVINGDDSLSSHKESFQSLLKKHKESGAHVTVELTPTYSPNVHKNTYVRGRDGHVSSIRSTTEDLDEFLTGVCAVNVAFLKTHMKNMINSAVHGEYTLTSFYAKALDLGTLHYITNPHATRGMNTIEDWRHNMST